MLQQAVIAAGIAVAAQMKAIVRVIMAKAVIKLAEIEENRIVMICKIVVEPPEVLRSSSVATTSATMPAATRSGDVSSRSRLLHVFPLFDKRGLGRVR